MRDNPTVSIVLIFFNEEKYLADAIDSVIAQTYEDWELLVVDDGSSDGSPRIANDYVSRDSRIRYLQHSGGANRGMSESRNLGINEARGTYVAFLDGDDLILPNKLEDQVAILEAHPEAGAVCGRAEWWYDHEDRSSGDSNFIQRYRLALNSLHDPPALLVEFLTNEWASPCDMMVRRALSERIGGYESRFRGLYEDQAYHAKINLHAPVYVASNVWYRYRQHPGASTVISHSRGETGSVRAAFLQWLSEYVQSISSIPKESRAQLENVIRSKKFQARFARLDHARSKFLRALRFARAQVRAILGRDRYRPPIGGIRMGDLRRTEPIDKEFGCERGLPVDRYYVEQFLSIWSGDIRGHVLEIGDATYTKRYGGSAVENIDVLNIEPGDEATTIVADLTSATNIPDNTFDCIILTQTLQFIYDVPAAIATLHRILKPGGVLLATVPGISQTSDSQWGHLWYWRFSPISAKRLFTDVFGNDSVEIEAYGNVLSASAFLYGMAAHELYAYELDSQDASYDLITTIRAIKP